MMEPAGELPMVEDERSGRPYLLRRSLLLTFAGRVVSVIVLAAVDVAGLVVGLFAALVLRSLVRDPNVPWRLLWDQENDWLAFLILLLLLVFWRNRLYGPRELREGAGKIVSSVVLVSVLSLVFAIGTGQHFTTFGLYVAAAATIAITISVLRGAYETVTGALLRRLGVKRRVLLVGNPDQVAHLQATLGASRGRDRLRVRGPRRPGRRASRPALRAGPLDELIVAEGGLLAESELLSRS